MEKKILTDEELKKIKEADLKDMSISKKKGMYTITDDLTKKKGE